VIALAFGSIYNILVRRFVAVEELPSAVTLKERMAGRLSLIRAKLTGKIKGE